MIVTLVKLVLISAVLFAKAFAAMEFWQASRPVMTGLLTRTEVAITLAKTLLMDISVLLEPAVQVSVETILGKNLNNVISGVWDSGAPWTVFPSQIPITVLVMIHL